MPASSRSTRVPPLGRRGEGWVVLQNVLLAAVVAAGLLSGGLPAWTRVPGLVLLAAGLVLAALALRGLGESLSPFPRPRRRATLKSRGVYARARHPVYGGLVLAALGWSLALRSVAALALAAALAVVLDLKSRLEEQWLAERFEGYGEYRRRVRRRLLPFLY